MSGASAGQSGTPGHGSIVLIKTAGTSCMICAREYPSWCITIASHTEAVENLPVGTRVRTENVLDRFAIDWSLCGIYVEECPFDELEWASNQAVPGWALSGLTHEIADLAPRR